jgi:spermidine dehydrogenase
VPVTLQVNINYKISLKEQPVTTSDKKLGMSKAITRRDFIYGAGALTAASLLPLSALSSAVQSSHSYPPALTGMRGNHDGSFDVAHQLGREGKTDWGPINKLTDERYDLVVVGAGISGLSAAYFYLKQNPKATILIIENHDDFGGHARRNEFQVGDEKLLTYGGAQAMTEPESYSDVVKVFLEQLGVGLDRVETSFQQDFYKKHGLSAGVHFNKAKWGKDTTVAIDPGYFDGWTGLIKSPLSKAEAVDQMPISEAAKEQLKRIFLFDTNQLPGLSEAENYEYLSTISYRDYLIKHLDITEPEVFAVLEDFPMDWGVGIDAISAYNGFENVGLPGWASSGMAAPDNGTTWLHHFPDGNVSVARLLVRTMIDGVAEGGSMEDVVTAQFDYSKLDQAGEAVKLRLNSTVTNVEEKGERGISVSYVRDGQAYQVQTKDCVLACNNSVIPYLCPQLPEPQREALANQVKSPIIYTSVAVRNWKAWAKMGIGGVLSPGSYHTLAMLDFPIDLGDYAASANPDEPIIVNMERFPHRNNENLTAKQQYRLGRHEMMTTSFETIERNVREQLNSLLGEAGFDAARDIAGITVNRWGHGYAYWYNSLFDTQYEDRNDERYPHVQARKPFGRITIANADAGASADMGVAIDQAHRAVSELA